jgi:homoserine dehydrogenase
MIQSGSPYADALAEAQQLGYAEADPTEDVTGADAAAKIAILASLAFHTRIQLEEVAHVGIDNLDLADVEHAAELGYAVKLIASARQLEGKVAARVHPCLLPASHPLAGVEGAFNAVMLQGRSIREVILEGPGAGGEETATAVIGDVIAVIGTQGTGFLQHDVYFREVGRFDPNLLESPCYLRVTVDDTPGVLAQVAQQLADNDVSVAQVVQHPSDEGVHIVILTHRAREGDVRAAAASIAALPFSRSSPVVLPVLERD